MSKVVEIANEIHQDLDSPINLSAGLIAYWLQGHIGDLNNLINGSFVINGEGDFTPNIGVNETSIFKRLYLIHYYDKKTRDTLTLANDNSVLEISEGGATVRLLNKNETAKTYKTLKKDEEIELHKLVAGYKINAASPEDVTGKDTVEGSYADDESSCT